MFFTNVFSFASRKEVVEHAYASTLRQLRDRANEIWPVLERHGLSLREDVLARPRFDVWASVGLGTDRAVFPTTVPTRDLRDALETLGDLLGD